MTRKLSDWSKPGDDIPTYVAQGSENDMITDLTLRIAYTRKHAAEDAMRAPQRRARFTAPRRQTGVNDDPT